MSTEKAHKVAFRCQMLALDARKGYISGMEFFSAEQVRAFFVRYLDRKGQGAMKRAVEVTKVSRQHLNRFKNGKTDLGWETRQALLKLMQDEGFAPHRNVANEEPTRYSTEPEPEPETVLALKLEAMASQLRSPFFSAANKAEDFLKFVENLANSLDAHITALKKRPDTRE